MKINIELFGLKWKVFNHPVVKKLLNHLKIKQVLEIHYAGDLPGFSGMGSSSAFTVGLMNALYCLLNKKISNYDLAKNAIHFEQKIMKEIVGSQDQLATAIGGFNKITFKKKDNFKIISKATNKNIKKLEENLLLIYTGKKRIAQNVAKKYSNQLTTKSKKYVDLMIQHVLEGEKIIKGKNIHDFGKLLHSAWIAKKKLSNQISNARIDEIYDYVLSKGATGGKLLGAGGGGFLLFYMKKNLQKSFLKRNKKLINVPFKFSDNGTEILYKD